MKRLFWYFSERIIVYPSGVEPKGSGTTACCRYVWDKDATPGAPGVKWLYPGKAKGAKW